MDKIDELIVDVALEYNGRRDYYAGRNIQSELKAIAKGEETLVKTNKKLAKSQKEVATSGFQLGKALKTLGIYIGVREIVRYADEWQRVANILNQVTSSEQERVELQEKLYQIGRRTRTSTAETADLYTSLGGSGLSGQQQLNATQILQKAFVATGSDSRTVESIKRMLRTGRLSTLLGINQSLAQIIASGMNTSLGELQQKIRKGGLTSMEVLQALSNRTSEINQKFTRTKSTLSDAFNGIRESVEHLLGKLEEKTGVFSGLAKMLNLLADNLAVVATILGTMFIAKFVKSVEVLDLFFLNLKDGMGILGSLKGVMLAVLPTIKAFTAGAWALTAPLLKVYAVLELINQTIKMFKGEKNLYTEFIDKIERGTWWLMNKATGQNKVFQGTFSSDLNPATSGQGVSHSSNIVNNITINESANGLTSAANLLQSSLRQATAGGY